MNLEAVVGPSHDRSLADALAGIVRDLRSRRRDSSGKDLQKNVRETADRFVGRLANHFRYTEESIFPALRELKPGAAPAIEGMEKGHRLLQQYLRDLAGEIKVGSEDGACGVARSFLATILDHLHRETAMLSGFVQSLDDLQARRLSKLLAGGHSMGFVIPDGWEQDSETLYLHTSGVRIERMVYRKKEGWILIPVDLNRPVMEFSPTDEGRDEAFSAFAKGLLEPKETGVTKEVKEAREAARRDEDPFASSDDEEEDDEDES